MMSVIARGFYWLLFQLFAVLPLDAASAVGGWLGRTLGPRLGVRKIARRNLVAAFPEKSAAEIEAIMVEMWDNLGRVMAEFPHVTRLEHPPPVANHNHFISFSSIAEITDHDIRPLHANLTLSA